MILLQYIRLNILDNLEKCLKGKRNRNGTMDSFFLLSAKKTNLSRIRTFRNFNERTFYRSNLHCRTNRRANISRNGDVPDIFLST